MLLSLYYNVVAPIGARQASSFGKIPAGVRLSWAFGREVFSYSVDGGKPCSAELELLGLDATPEDEALRGVRRAQAAQGSSCTDRLLTEFVILKSPAGALWRAFLRCCLCSALHFLAAGLRNPDSAAP